MNLQFGNMHSLEEIQLEGNPLEHPYDCIYRKSPLLLVSFFNTETEVLDLSSCGIEEIPNEIGRLQRLYNLDLSYNGISEVPFAVGKLYNLVTFNLDGNPLKVRQAFLLSLSPSLFPVLSFSACEVNHPENCPKTMQNDRDKKGRPETDFDP